SKKAKRIKAETCGTPCAAPQLCGMRLRRLISTTPGPHRVWTPQAASGWRSLVKAFLWAREETRKTRGKVLNARRSRKRREVRQPPARLNLGEAALESVRFLRRTRRALAEQRLNISRASCGDVRGPSFSG